MKKQIVFLLSLFFAIFQLQAAYLENVPMTLIQPNGDTLHCLATGDEYYHYLHDANGFTIMLNPATGYYVYADKIGDRLIPTDYVAGITNPQAVGLRPHLNISAEQWVAKRAAMTAQVMHPTNRNSRDNNHGTMNNLVVFIKFSGDGDFSSGYSTIQNMFNDSSTTTSQSMYNYFKNASYNQLFIKSYFYPAPNGNTIVAYEDSHPRSYYLPYSSTNTDGYSSESEHVNREHTLLRDAILYIRDSVSTSIDFDYNNDGYVDNVCFVVRGTVGDWSDLLWPHRWSLYSYDVYLNGKRVYDYNFQLQGSSTYFTVSTLCHEMFHTLGAPDLYHYDVGTDLSPAGRWDLMCSNTTPPQHSTTYMKFKYGQWLDSIPTLRHYGHYSLKPEGSSKTNNCYKIPTSNSHQFYVLEYRNTGSNYFESNLYGSGLVIYRIDDRFTGNADYNGTTSFDELYIFRPGGTTTANGSFSNSYFSANSGRTSFDVNTDPYPFLSDGTMDSIYISDIGNVGDSITFLYGPISYFCALPVNPSVTVDSSTIHLHWSSGGNATSYNIYRNNQLQGTSTDTTYTQMNVPSGIYQYAISAVCPIAESPRVSTSTVIVGDTCIPPTNVAATNTIHNITLSWEPATTSLYYKIYRNNALIDSTYATHYVDSSSSLHYLTSYLYRIKAVCAHDNSELSASVTSQLQLPTYTITASATTGGEVSPSGTVSVTYGNSSTFSFSANAGYVLSDILLDGVSVGATNPYTLSVITANHTLRGVFSEVECNAPTNVFAEQITSPTGGPGILLHWDAVPNAENYVIYMGNTPYWEVDTNFRQVYGLSLNLNYCFSVAPVCSEAEGDRSEQTCIILSGIEDYESTSLVLFPNPVQDVLHIQCEKQMGRIILFDIYGKKLQEKTIDGMQTDFSMRAYPAGIYILQIQSNNNFITKKILKE